jgi:DNA gyrase/topoisomerase IV subunit A
MEQRLQDISKRVCLSLLLKYCIRLKFTDWGVSYDGRRAEPNNLPVKFPLLLAQGAEGIALDFRLKYPHNFNELIDASIKY